MGTARKVQCPYPEMVPYSLSFGTQRLVPLEWNPQARRLEGTFGPLSRGAPVLLYPVHGEERSDSTNAARWLNAWGYTSVRLMTQEERQKLVQDLS